MIVISLRGRTHSAHTSSLVTWLERRAHRHDHHRLPFNCAPVYDLRNNLSGCAMTKVDPAIANVPPTKTPRTRSVPWGKLLAIIVLIGFGFLLWPVAERIYLAKRFFGHVRHVCETIDGFEARCPPTVPEAQWKRAVEWTSNVICQDFFGPNWEELTGLEALSQELDARSEGDVDLKTLQWIWDQCEEACGGPKSYGIRFRDLKLLHDGPINDDNLADVWSIDRCPYLDLSDTRISDASIPFLATLARLETVSLERTLITDEGAQQLRQARPNVEVFFDRRDRRLNKLEQSSTLKESRRGASTF